MKVRAFPKWVTYAFAISTLGWIVMIIIDLVTKQESKFLFFAHIALAVLYLIATVVYYVQYSMAKRRRDKFLAQQEAEKQEAAKQAAVEAAIAQQNAVQQAAVAETSASQEVPQQ